MEIWPLLPPTGLLRSTGHWTRRPGGFGPGMFSRGSDCAPGVVALVEGSVERLSTGLGDVGRAGRLTTKLLLGLGGGGGESVGPKCSWDWGEEPLLLGTGDRRGGKGEGGVSDMA